MAEAAIQLEQVTDEIARKGHSECCAASLPTRLKATSPAPTKAVPSKLSRPDQGGDAIFWSDLAGAVLPLDLEDCPFAIRTQLLLIPSLLSGATVKYDKAPCNFC